ncbi:cytochrome c biogenesis protein, transmembrane region [Isosphaera pallida ATCC 43644]|uniref:Cytochrome c biogenesis protein, transmembrane region n=1 Tax=Isosphaera pallida (strain ATCC 43644 / DSM 9630 / IS1B) TaxID=575540 RepID=E8QZ04_ISOPI|nr:aromatic aminobenezylarsenical efflux permease ArsG family transporter [Isosphaera pallida]ADV63146.1 cytochrome c biogenesis protein, transmembrane region [Isosphaera pallida ATCC 43644]
MNGSEVLTGEATTTLWASATAVWLGVLTSISPCPLATNLAAISFIGRRAVGEGEGAGKGSSAGVWRGPRRVAVGGVSYTLGRMLTYVLVAGLLVAGLLSAPSLAQTLQRVVGKVVGPLAIVVGMVLVGLIQLKTPGGPGDQGWTKRLAQSGGLGGAFLLGMVFALTFCPVSAALFFGALVPLALTKGSPVVLPALYGIGTALPVFGFALLLAFGVRAVGRAFNAVGKVERVARLGTGAVFIAAGIAVCLSSIYHVF